MTLSAMIQFLSDLKAQKKELEAAVKDIDSEISNIETEIIMALDNSGVKETASTVAKVAITERVYPKVESWDNFGNYILDNRWLHLLERRPAVLAYRELLTLGRVVPGVLPFQKRALSFTPSKD